MKTLNKYARELFYFLTAFTFFCCLDLVLDGKAFGHVGENIFIATLLTFLIFGVLPKVKK